MNFTEKEFDTIIEALECLPNKNDAGFMLSSLVGISLSKRDGEQGYKYDLEERKIAHEAEKRKLKEDFTILIGKFIQMKREIYPE